MVLILKCLEYFLDWNCVRKVIVICLRLKYCIRLILSEKLLVSKIIKVEKSLFMVLVIIVDEVC